MKPKSKAVAALLAFFLGGFGIHRFYLGKVGSGITMLILSIIGPFLLYIPNIIVIIWGTIDFILILCGKLGDYKKVLA